MMLATAVVVLVVTFANFFTVIQSVMGAGDWSNALWMVGGPIFFSLLALGIYENYRRRTAVSFVVSAG
ncbi:Inner membrane transporter YjeM [Klebsiella huaxiensis]|uniref:Inner membrane transporter YjeM n=1 Tax=Klebsiella huaxiensis TaxID=2153354 RepID=A0A564N8Z9_9ENTR|nr:Inner membrane transporter YjeM [Klebsiella huaxiensis]